MEQAIKTHLEGNDGNRDEIKIQHSWNYQIYTASFDILFSLLFTVNHYSTLCSY
jgi:hypothetical protein